MIAAALSICQAASSHRTTEPTHPVLAYKHFIFTHLLKRCFLHGKAICVENQHDGMVLFHRHPHGHVSPADDLKCPARGGGEDHPHRCPPPGVGNNPGALLRHGFASRRNRNLFSLPGARACRTVSSAVPRMLTPSGGDVDVIVCPSRD